MLLAGPGFQIAEGELGGIVKGLACGIAEGGALFHDLGLVEHGFGFQDCLFGELENGVHAADDAHGEDDIGVFAAFDEVAMRG